MSKSARGALITGISAAAIGLIASIMPSLLALEESFGLRILYALRGSVDPPANVVIASINNESAEALGLREDLRSAVGLTGWPRSLHADLVATLQAAGVKLIAFDIHFREPREESTDELFVAAVETAGSVILFDGMERTYPLSAEDAARLGVEAYADRRIPPFPSLEAAAVETAPFPLPDVPIRVYQYWAFASQANYAPTLPVIAFQFYADSANQEIVRHLREIRPNLLGDGISGDFEQMAVNLRAAFQNDASIADVLLDRLDDEAYSESESSTLTEARSLIDLFDGPDGRYLNYYGPPRTITTVPIHSLLLDGPDPDINWEGAAVLVGFSSSRQAGQRDQFDSVYFLQSGLGMSGVEIAATALANLIENRTLRVLPIHHHLGLVVLIGLVFGASFLARSVLAASVTLGLSLIFYLGVVIYQFSYAGNWWPIVIPALLQAPVALVLGMSLHYVRAKARQEAVARGVSRYLPSDLVERIAENSSTATRDSELIFGTCMVTDMERFTAFAEGKSPRSLETELNAYYDALFSIVDDQHGLVTDIVGDSMVAVWNLSSDVTEHRTHAIGAAMEIANKLSAQDSGFPRTRVGIHSGEFILGTVGAREHLEYRAVGDVVNSASRIQALNKRLGTTILTTHEALRNADVRYREIGTFQLAGKEVALNVYEPICLGVDLSRSQEELIDQFSLALREFREGQWEQAINLFAAISKDFENDGPSSFYVRYIQSLLDSSSLTRQDYVIRFVD